MKVKNQKGANCRADHLSARYDLGCLVLLWAGHSSIVIERPGFERYSCLTVVTRHCYEPWVVIIVFALNTL
jgi:hypothetical protein